MYERKDKDFILDMFLACQRILKYIKDLSFEKFLKDDKTIDAVIRNIEILGEATKNLSESFTNKHKQIEWSKIAKARDKLIHFYFGINEEIVWDIATNDIPALLKKLKDLIEKEGWSDEIS